jgi:tRNA A37 threonylcarbamoyladenosine dehydratase
MKYLILFCFILLTASCDAQTSPKNVVKEFLYAIDNLDYVKAKKALIVNDNNLEALKNMKKFGDSMTPSQRAKYLSSKKTYVFKEEEILPSKAQIIAVSQEELIAMATEFYLKKVGNQWLIDRFISR